MSEDGETRSKDMAYKDEVYAEAAVYEDEPPVEEVVHEDEPPVEEVLHEDEPPAEEVLHEDEPPAEEGVHEDEPPVEAALAHHVKISPEDLAYYQGWESLSPLRKRKRVKKLKARGLPIPDEDRSIPVFVT